MICCRFLPIISCVEITFHTTLLKKVSDPWNQIVQDFLNLIILKNQMKYISWKTKRLFTLMLTLCRNHSKKIESLHEMMKTDSDKKILNKCSKLLVEDSQIADFLALHYRSNCGWLCTSFLLNQSLCKNLHCIGSPLLTSLEKKTV